MALRELVQGRPENGPPLADLSDEVCPNFQLDTLGPNSIETFWLEFWLEKSLEFWLEIPNNKKMFKKWEV